MATPNSTTSAPQMATAQPPAPSSPHAATVFVFTKKAAKGAYARFTVGTHNNAAQWQATVTAIQQGNGKATGASIMAAIQAATPHSASNAAPFLRYLQGSMGLLAPQAPPAKS